MPEISRFFGIVVRMYFLDHEPPHFHATYAEKEAQVRIKPVGLLAGTLPARALAPWILPRGGVFEPLHDPTVFAQVSVDSEAGTVVWPNGVDLDPDVLYEAAHSASVGSDR